MRIDSHTRGGVVVVSVHSPRIDSAVTPQFVQAATTAIAGARDVVMDLSRVSLVDSTGLGGLVGLRKALGPDGALGVVATQPAVLHLFRLTRLDSVIPLYPSVDAAVEARSSNAPSGQ